MLLGGEEDVGIRVAGGGHGWVTKVGFAFKTNGTRVFFRRSSRACSVVELS